MTSSLNETAQGRFPEIGQDPEKRLELLANGYFYDVANFVDRHPGGELINMYLNNGEDATHALQQFHYRSSKKVSLMLQSFPKRPATEQELETSVGGQTQLTRHRALTRDFTALFQELVNEGMFEPCLSHVLFRYLELTILATTGLLLFINGWNLGIPLIIWGCGRSGWFVHEAGHHSFTGRPGLDRFLQSHIYGIYWGLSGACWRNHHSKHHAMPQHLHNDIDLSTLPLMAFHTKVVQDPKRQFGFLVKYQKWLAYIVQSTCIGFYWKWVEDPLYAWRKGEWGDLIHMAIHQLLIFQLGIPTYLFCGMVIMSYMILNATLSHTHLPITEARNTHWVEYSLVHTANVKSSWWVDYFMGYLNYQIEHHLFPTMPQFRNKLCRDRVKALAAKYSLPYHLFDYKTIVIKTVQNLADVSKQLAQQLNEDSRQAGKVSEGITNIHDETLDNGESQIVKNQSSFASVAARQRALHATERKVI